jgi:hypothetical protein
MKKVKKQKKCNHIWVQLIEVYPSGAGGGYKVFCQKCLEKRYI